MVNNSEDSEFSDDNSDILSGDVSRPISYESEKMTVQMMKRQKPANQNYFSSINSI